MTDDLTRPTETPPQPETGDAPPEAAASTEAAATTAAQPASTTDTSMAGSGSPAAASGSRVRWMLALGVVALAAIVAVGAIVILGSKPTPPALAYIPSDSTVVVELRPDLPGDQVQKLGNLLAHFPGFLDQSTLPAKLDEAFSKLVGQASNGSVD